MIYDNHIPFCSCVIFVLGYNMFFEVESYIPIGRVAHSSVLVGNKLFFFGGMIDSGITVTTNEVFYLDLSLPFNVLNPPWVDLTSAAAIPFRAAWATVALDIDTNNIYLIGGLDVIAAQEFVYIFNANTLSWSISNATNSMLEKRSGTKAISDSSRKIYIFSGESAGSSAPRHLLNDTSIFNTVDNSWIVTFSSKSPTPRALYSATLLSNGVIVYIGGFEGYNNNIVDISQISLYYTNSSTWLTKKAILSIQIDNRFGHTAVLGVVLGSSRIIVHGGSKNFTTIHNARAHPDIAVLNTTTEPFEWVVPFVSSKLDFIPSFASHTADLAGNYMIVAFGNISKQDNEPSVKNSNIYLMDIRNYTWVRYFVPLDSQIVPTTASKIPSPTTTTTTTDGPSLSKGTIAGIIVGNIVGIAFFGVAIFFGYKFYKKSKKIANIKKIAKHEIETF